jgi:hypothetical protein
LAPYDEIFNAGRYSPTRIHKQANFLQHSRHKEYSKLNTSPAVIIDPKTKKPIVTQTIIDTGSNTLQSDSEDSDEQDMETASINQRFPFAKVIDDRKPEQTQVRMSVKTKEEFEDINKFKLKDQTKSKQYN